MCNAEASHCQVAVRIRPHTAKEQLENADYCTKCDDDGFSLRIPQLEKLYRFDKVLSHESSQETVYQAAQNVIDAFYEGYNATIIAYGQTGSGKTYTMGSAPLSNASSETEGIIPRFSRNTFETCKAKESTTKMDISCTYIEIYNETIKDLFDMESYSQSKCLPTQPRKRIKIQEDPITHQINLIGLTRKAVTSYDEMSQCFVRGSLHRTTGSTGQNSVSSRSHAIFTVTLLQEDLEQETGTVTNTSGSQIEESMQREKNKPNIKNCRISKIHFVDLAGSERVKRSLAEGSRLRESIHINSGLLALGNVIFALTDPNCSSTSHVPYRSSRITRILQDSLGGNSKTLMIACVSGAHSDFAETYNTIKYACRARTIKVHACINRDPTNAMIDSLKRQVNDLNAKLLEMRLSANQNATLVSDDVNDYEGTLGLSVQQLESRIFELEERAKQLETSRDSYIIKYSDSTKLTKLLQNWIKENNAGCDISSILPDISSDFPCTNNELLSLQNEIERLNSELKNQLDDIQSMRKNELSLKTLLEDVITQKHKIENRMSEILCETANSKLSNGSEFENVEDLQETDHYQTDTNSKDQIFTKSKSMVSPASEKENIALNNIFKKDDKNKSSVEISSSIYRRDTPEQLDGHKDQPNSGLQSKHLNVRFLSTHGESVQTKDIKNVVNSSSNAEVNARSRMNLKTKKNSPQHAQITSNFNNSSKNVSRTRSQSSAVSKKQYHQNSNVNVEELRKQILERLNEGIGHERLFKLKEKDSAAVEKIEELQLQLHECEQALIHCTEAEQREVCLLSRADIQDQLDTIEQEHQFYLKDIERLQKKSNSGALLMYELKKMVNNKDSHAVIKMLLNELDNLNKKLYASECKTAELSHANSTYSSLIERFEIEKSEAEIEYRLQFQNLIEQIKKLEMHQSDEDHHTALVTRLTEKTTDKEKYSNIENNGSISCNNYLKCDEFSNIDKPNNFEALTSADAIDDVSINYVPSNSQKMYLNDTSSKKEVDEWPENTECYVLNKIIDELRSRVKFMEQSNHEKEINLLQYSDVIMDLRDNNTNLIHKLKVSTNEILEFSTTADKDRKLYENFFNKVRESNELYEKQLDQQNDKIKWLGNKICMLESIKMNEMQNKSNTPVTKEIQTDEIIFPQLSDQLDKSVKIVETLEEQNNTRMFDSSDAADRIHLSLNNPDDKLEFNYVSKNNDNDPLIASSTSLTLKNVEIPLELLLKKCEEYNFQVLQNENDGSVHFDNRKQKSNTDTSNSDVLPSDAPNAFKNLKSSNYPIDVVSDDSEFINCSDISSPSNFVKGEPSNGEKCDLNATCVLQPCLVLSKHSDAAETSEHVSSKVKKDNQCVQPTESFLNVDGSNIVISSDYSNNYLSEDNGKDVGVAISNNASNCTIEKSLIKDHGTNRRTTQQFLKQSINSSSNVNNVKRSITTCDMSTKDKHITLPDEECIKSSSSNSGVSEESKRRISVSPEMFIQRHYHCNDRRTNSEYFTPLPEKSFKQISHFDVNNETASSENISSAESEFVKITPPTEYLTSASKKFPYSPSSQKCEYENNKNKEPHLLRIPSCLVKPHYRQSYSLNSDLQKVQSVKSTVTMPSRGMHSKSKIIENVDVHQNAFSAMLQKSMDGSLQKRHLHQNLLIEPSLAPKVPSETNGILTGAPIRSKVHSNHYSNFFLGRGIDITEKVASAFRPDLLPFTEEVAYVTPFYCAQQVTKAHNLYLNDICFDEEHHWSSSTCWFNPKKLVTGSVNSIRIWDLEHFDHILWEYRSTDTVASNCAQCSNIKCIENGNILVSTIGNVIKTFDLRDSPSQNCSSIEMPVSSGNRISMVLLTPLNTDGCRSATYLAACGNEPCVRTYDLRQSKKELLITSIPTKDRINCMGIIPSLINEKTNVIRGLVVVTQNKQVMIWDHTDWVCIDSDIQNAATCCDLMNLGDATRSIQDQRSESYAFILGKKDGSLQYWTAQNSIKPYQKMQALSQTSSSLNAGVHRHSITSFSGYPSRNILISADREGCIKFWNPMRSINSTNSNKINCSLKPVPFQLRHGGSPISHVISSHFMFISASYDGSLMLFRQVV